MERLSPSEVLGIVLQPIEKVTETLERKLGLFSVVILSLLLQEIKNKQMKNILISFIFIFKTTFFF